MARALATYQGYLKTLPETQTVRVDRASRANRAIRAIKVHRAHQNQRAYVVVSGEGARLYIQIACPISGGYTMLMGLRSRFGFERVLTEAEIPVLVSKATRAETFVMEPGSRNILLKCPIECS